MRSKSDPISTLKDRMLNKNMASVEEFKVLEAHTHINIYSQTVVKSDESVKLNSYHSKMSKECVKIC